MSLSRKEKQQAWFDDAEIQAERRHSIRSLLCPVEAVRRPGPGVEPRMESCCRWHGLLFDKWHKPLIESSWATAWEPHWHGLRERLPEDSSVHNTYALPVFQFPQ